MSFRGRWYQSEGRLSEPLRARLAQAAGLAGARIGRLAERSPWLAERLSFYHAWRENPKGIGAIMPSSRALADAITREIDPAAGPVIELGPGTGVFTRALLARDVSPSNLALVERDAQLAARLRRQFPAVSVFAIDACHLDKQPLFPQGLAAAAVCGLPLLNLPLRVRLRILRATFAQLQTDGACYLFTYGVRCPVPHRLLERLGLRARKTAVVLANIPPAHIWKLTRRLTPCGRSFSKA